MTGQADRRSTSRRSLEPVVAIAAPTSSCQAPHLRGGALLSRSESNRT